MKRPPHAQLHLPPLTAHDALALVSILERAIAAVWRAHGDSMADLQAACVLEADVSVPGPRENDAEPF